MFLSPSLCVAPQFVAEELLHAEGFIGCAVCPHRGTTPVNQTLLIAGRSTSTHDFVAPFIIQRDAGDPGRVPGRRTRRLLRALRHRARPRHSRSQGARRSAIPGYRLRPARVPRQHGWLMSGFDPRKDVTFVTHLPGRVEAALWPRGRSTPSWASPGPAGASGEEGRPCHRQQRPGPTLVAVLLLHGRGATGSSSASTPSPRSGRSALF